MLVKLKKNYILIGFIICIVYLYPLIWGPIINNGHGIYDWDHVSQRYAAIYQTIINYGQPPGNNIWLGGGQPLVQTYSAYGVFGILVLSFGVKLGIYLSILTYYAVGYWGSIKLAGEFTSDKLRQTLFAAYVVFSNSLAYHLEVGHLQFVNILVVPYVIYLCTGAKRTYHAVILGLIIGVSFLDGPAYTGQYIFMLAIFILFIRVYGGNEERSRIINYLLVFLIAYISVVFYKIFGLMQLFNEFPRVTQGNTNYNIFNWFDFSFWPRVRNVYVDIESNSCRGVWENGNYLGVIALLLLVNLVRTRPKYLGIMLIYLVAAYSNDRLITDFNHYLKMIPTFNSHLCTARVRLFSPILMGVLLLMAYRNINTLKIGSLKLSINLLLFFLVIEVGVASFLVAENSHQYTDRKTPEVNQSYFSISQKQLHDTSLTEATLANIGVNDVFESYVPLVAKKNIIDSPNTEYTQGGRVVKPIYWSPNHLVFSTTDLDNCIETNIHISKNWRVNGQYVYENRKSYEPEELICVRPDDTGRLVLSYEVKHGTIVMAINIILLICSGCIGLQSYRRRGL